MKKISYLFVLAFTALSCVQAQKTAFSEKALSEKLNTQNQQSVAFADILKKHNGKTTVIEIWASWCGDCVKSMPKLKQLQKDHPDVDYVFISMDKAEDKWKAGITKHELNGDHYWAVDGMKGAFAKTIDLDWIPRYIIIDKNSKIVTYRAIETDFDQINTTLKTLK